MQRIRIGFVSCLFLAAISIAQAFAADSPEIDGSQLISQGIAFRQQGDFQQSIDLLTEVRRSSPSGEIQARAAGELGISLLEVHRYELSDAQLQHAHAHFKGTERARYAIYLGNLALIRKQIETARTYYREARELAGEDANIRLSVGLNLARLAPQSDRLGLLASLSMQLGKADHVEAADLARYHLNLGNQARQLGADGLPLAYQHLEQSRKLALGMENKRPLVDALDALAQLYEEHGRGRDALTLTRQAIQLGQSLDQGSVADLLINLEWRQGRLFRAEGAASQALAAYQRAVSLVESVRQDIPIEYEDGRSSFRETLEPIYLGYADLMLQRLERQVPEVRAQHLRQVVDTIELIKQAEMQDFLGDRCSVEAVQGGGASGVPAGTAVLYPLILPDRVELLLETSSGIVRETTPVNSTSLRSTSSTLAESLRNGLPDYMSPSRKLYDWLLKPFEGALDAQQIHSLVIVPDGVLRLVPMGALYDGKQYVIEKYAVSMVTGMSMTNTAGPTGRRVASLVVGMSEPGPVVEKLRQAEIKQVLNPNSVTVETSRGVTHNRTLRSARLRSLDALAGAQRTTRSTADALREAYALPGVKFEVEELTRVLNGTSMLNAAFTVSGFRQEVAAGEYRIVHIASHGVFGGSADASYILAYDDLLTLDSLQSLLQSERFRKNPIELLSLSACETAEGDDRSPLGISGAAMKARAKSVLGTLWPVEDTAARNVMEKFYGGLAVTHLSKAEALRQAQIELIHNDDFKHPFFWAPFVLIGNWQ